MHKMPLRRFTDKIRLIADEAWSLGYKELSDELHELARKAEKLRKEKFYNDRY